MKRLSYIASLVLLPLRFLLTRPPPPSSPALPTRK